MTRRLVLQPRHARAARSPPRQCLRGPSAVAASPRRHLSRERELVMPRTWFGGPMPLELQVQEELSESAARVLPATPDRVTPSTASTHRIRREPARLTTGRGCGHAARASGGGFGSWCGRPAGRTTGGGSAGIPGRGSPVGPCRRQVAGRAVCRPSGPTWPRPTEQAILSTAAHAPARSATAAGARSTRRTGRTSSPPSVWSSTPASCTRPLGHSLHPVEARHPTLRAEARNAELG